MKRNFVANFMKLFLILILLLFVFELLGFPSFILDGLLFIQTTMFLLIAPFLILFIVILFVLIYLIF